MTVTVDNEANLAALAELHASTQPRPSFLYISGRSAWAPESCWTAGCCGEPAGTAASSAT